MYKVKIANLKEFRGSRDTWNALASKMKFPSMFCTWEWHYAWMETFGEGYEPLILFIWEGSELKGIFPMSKPKRSAPKNLFSTRLLSYCGSSQLYSDHVDVICLKEDGELCLSAVFEFFNSEYAAWDEIELGLVSEESNIWHYFEKNKSNLSTKIEKKSVAPYLSLSGSFDAYMKTFNSKQRYNITSRRKKLIDQFGITYSSGKPGEILKDLETLFHLHNLRANKKNISSTFNGELLLKFHHNLANLISKTDCLWLRFLRNKDDIVSALYGFEFGRHLFYYQIGIDPKWEKYGPGSVLIYEAIQEAFNKNLLEFDFLRGNEEYKSQWTQNQRSLYSIHIYKKSLKGSIASMIMVLQDFARKVLRTKKK